MFGMVKYACKVNSSRCLTQNHRGTQGSSKVYARMHLTLQALQACSFVGSNPTVRAKRIAGRSGICPLRTQRYMQGQACICENVLLDDSPACKKQQPLLLQADAAALPAHGYRADERSAKIHFRTYHRALKCAAAAADRKNRERSICHVFCFQIPKKRTVQAARKSFSVAACFGRQGRL